MNVHRPIVRMGATTLITWATLAAFSPTVLNSTPLNVIAGIAEWRYVLVVTCAAAASVAVWASLYRSSVLWYIPQHLLLCATVFGPLAATIKGQYADGVSRDRLFIAVDQAPIIVLVLFHTLAMLAFASRLNLAVLLGGKRDYSGGHWCFSVARNDSSGHSDEHSHRADHGPQGAD